MAKDYYSILGVDKTASADQIKSAYRKLAKQYHPDLHPNDPVSAEKFKECNEAYSVLGDEDNRRKYDNGEYDMQNGGGYGNPFGGGFSASGFDDIFDIFSSFMGGGGRSSSRHAENVGSDVNYNLDLTFMEAARGCKKTLKFTRKDACPDCKGTGAKDASSVQTCPHCKGTGQVKYVQNTLFGQSVRIGTCEKCNGTGKVVTNPCKTCNGKGVISKAMNLSVEIPAGLQDGSVVPISGQGNATQNGRNGNLNLIIRVRPSKVFVREGNNLRVVVPVSFATAVLGGEVEIPSLNGVFVHKLPENTQNGDTLRFRGKGIRGVQGYAGDLFVTINVEVPKSISRAQRKAMAEFEREDSIKNYPKRKAYMDEVAELYKDDK
ncbi:MAG: molecular chaperone DnaJ [Clostridia bacterium]|nr:molecular chaperone DnaJ [Clostridia bacterium]